MLSRLSKYLWELRKNATRFERTDINGSEDKTTWSKHSKQIISAITAVVLIFLLPQGFPLPFVSYTSGVLSILVGLFITTLIFSFDKFHQTQNRNTKVFSITINRKDDGSKEKEFDVSMTNITELNSKEKLWHTQSYNYTRQFAYITGYNIILSLIVIVFLSLNSLFPNYMNINLRDYELTLNKINCTTVGIFTNIISAIFQRFLVIYLIGNIIHQILFIVSSMVNFMTIKIERENDSN